jgi:hypothetical protein
MSSLAQSKMFRVCQQLWVKTNKRLISSVESYMALSVRSLKLKTRSSKLQASQPRTDKRLTLSEEDYKVQLVRSLRLKELLTRWLQA